MWRQPLGARAWSVALAPALLASGAPIALSAWFFGDGAALRGAMMSALWVPMALGLGSGSSAGLGLTAISAAFAFAGLWLADVAVVWPVALVAVASLPIIPGSTYAWLRARPSPVRGALPGRPSTAFMALIRHDLLCLWRLDGDVIGDLWLPVIPAFVALRALSVRASPLICAWSGLLVVVAAGGLGAVAVGRVALREGSRLDPPSWPIRASTRAMSLWGFAVLAMPTTAFAMSAGRPGAAGRELALSVALAAGSALLACRPMRAGARRVNLGAWMWWAMLAFGVALIRPPWGEASDVALALAGLAFASFDLRRQRGGTG